MIKTLVRIPPLPAILLLCGCNGANTLGFITTDNFGINVQATDKATAEIAYSRREGVIEPSYGRGAVPTVAAAVQHNADSFWSLGYSSKAVFSGGNAARYVAGDRGDSVSGLDAVACIKPPTGGAAAPPDHGALVFGTDSSIGFKIEVPATAATGGMFPNVHLGYRRNEFAIGTVSGDPGGCVSKSENGYTYGVYSPSFLAVINAGADASAPPSPGTKDKSKFDVGQIFATGKAAEVIARTSTFHGLIAQVGGTPTTATSIDATPSALVQAVTTGQDDIKKAIETLDTALKPLNTDLKKVTNASTIVPSTTPDDGLSEAREQLKKAIVTWEATKTTILKQAPFLKGGSDKPLCATQANKLADTLLKALIAAPGSQPDLLAKTGIDLQTAKSTANAWLDAMKKQVGDTVRPVATASAMVAAAIPSDNAPWEAKKVTGATQALQAIKETTAPVNLCPALTGA